MPRVSVLLTNYNASAHVGTAMMSVYVQTFTDWELLVLDDGSDDPETLKALEAFEWFAARDSRVRVWYLHPTPEQRAATCRYATLVNAGAAHTTGELITYLCGDDFYMPDRLERMVAELDARDCSVVYGPQRMVREDGTEIGVRPAAEGLSDAFHRVDLNSVMHTRAAFDAVGGWDDSADHWRDADAYFWRRLTDAGAVFMPVPGGPTDVKRYRADSVDERVKAGLAPWTT